MEKKVFAMDEIRLVQVVHGGSIGKHEGALAEAGFRRFPPEGEIRFMDRTLRRDNSGLYQVTRFGPDVARATHPAVYVEAPEKLIATQDEPADQRYWLAQVVADADGKSISWRYVEDGLTYHRGRMIAVVEARIERRTIKITVNEMQALACGLDHVRIQEIPEEGVFASRILDIKDSGELSGMLSSGFERATFEIFQDALSVVVRRLAGQIPDQRGKPAIQPQPKADQRPAASAAGQNLKPKSAAQAQRPTSEVRNPDHQPGQIPKDEWDRMRRAVGNFTNEEQPMPWLVKGVAQEWLSQTGGKMGAFAFIQSLGVDKKGLQDRFWNKPQGRQEPPKPAEPAKPTGAANPNTPVAAAAPGTGEAASPAADPATDAAGASSGSVLEAAGLAPGMVLVRRTTPVPSRTPQPPPLPLPSGLKPEQVRVKLKQRVTKWDPRYVEAIAVAVEAGSIKGLTTVRKIDTLGNMSEPPRQILEFDMEVWGRGTMTPGMIVAVVGKVDADIAAAKATAVAAIEARIKAVPCLAPIAEEVLKCGIPLDERNLGGLEKLDTELPATKRGLKTLTGLSNNSADKIWAVIEKFQMKLAEKKAATAATAVEEAATPATPVEESTLVEVVADQSSDQVIGQGVDPLDVAADIIDLAGGDTDVAAEAKPETPGANGQEALVEAAAVGVPADVTGECGGLVESA